MSDWSAFWLALSAAYCVSLITDALQSITDEIIKQRQRETDTKEEDNE